VLGFSNMIKIQYFIGSLLLFSSFILQAQSLSPDVSAALTQASAWRQQGQISKALQLLETQLSTQTDAHAQAALLGQLSELYLLSRQFQTALTAVTNSLQLAEQQDDRRLQAYALNYWGNILTQQQHFAEAHTQYQTALNLAQAEQETWLTASILLNLLYTEKALQQPLTQRLTDTLNYLEQLPDSADKALNFISLAQYQTLKIQQRYQLLSRAAELSDESDNARLHAFALGELGQLYQQQQRWAEAQSLTQRAIFYAQSWPDSVYRWQAQLAYILQQQDQISDAIQHYQAALVSLEKVRPVLYQTVTPSEFEESIAPIYFNLLDLLLAQASAATAETQQQLLQKAQQVMESYRVVELENFYQDECVTLQMRQKRQLAQVLTDDTAVFYPIILPQRTELLIQFRQHLYQVTRKDSEERDLTALVERFLSRRLATAESEKLYQWLITPIQPLLQQHQISTLVIVPHGALLRLPFAALISPDRHYLAQQYAIVITPSLQLTDPRPLTETAKAMLAGGVSDAVQEFPALPAVDQELSLLHDLFGGEQPLKNQSFVSENLTEQLRAQPYPFIHFATHSEFHSNPNDSFLLTYNGRLTLNELERFVRISRFRQQPVELLTLSACETAASALDQAAAMRAALGLAGIAVKAGARSVLASLWKVDDQATAQFMRLFYQTLAQEPTLSRAQLMQRTQLAMLETEFKHPIYWAAFVLIGSWL